MIDPTTALGVAVGGVTPVTVLAVGAVVYLGRVQRRVATIPAARGPVRGELPPAADTNPADVYEHRAVRSERCPCGGELVVVEEAGRMVAACASCELVATVPRPGAA